MFSFSGKSRLSCSLLGAAVAGAMAIGTQSVQAEMDLSFDSASVIANGPTAFNYTLEVGGVNGGLANISTNDYFVIVGFGATAAPVSNIGSAWKITSIDSSNLSSVTPAPTGLAYGPVFGSDGLYIHYGNNGAAANTITNTSDLLFQYIGTSTTIASPVHFAVYSLQSFVQPGSELGLYISPADTKAASDSIFIPAPSGIPAGSLPLPATFWPGLGTLAAMALAGGLKLRKKFV